MFAAGARPRMFANYLDAPQAHLQRRIFSNVRPTPATTNIDWDAAPAQLIDGDLSSLDSALAERLREVANDSQVQRWADTLKAEPIVLVVAALAYRDRDTSRTAERISRRIFGDTLPEWIGELESIVARDLDDVL